MRSHFHIFSALDDCNDYIFHDSYDVVPSKESCFLKEEVIEDIEGLSYDCKECLERFTTLDDLNVRILFKIMGCMNKKKVYTQENVFWTLLAHVE